MAFAAAAAGRTAVTETVNSSSSSSGELTIPNVSQKVWTLLQTCISLESLSGGIGGSSDTTNLRQRLQTTENTGITLQTDIENNLKKLRIQTMTTPDSSQQKQLKRLEDQYNEVRERFIKDVNESRIKRRQFTPQDLTGASKGSSSTTTNGSTATTNPVNASKRKINTTGSTNDIDPSQISIQMQNFTEVDAALIEERNREASELVQSTVELHSAMKDISVLVGEQGEKLEVIENNVDHALEHVEEGNKELEIAQKYASSYRKKCCCTGILLLALAAVIIIPILLHYGIIPKIQT